MFNFARNTFRRVIFSVAASLVLGVLAYTIVSPEVRAAAITAAEQTSGSGGSIHGYVAAVVQPQLEARQTTSLGTQIFVSDIDVWAKNIKTGVSSSHVVTNAEGYFRTPLLPIGEYQICVSGTGYTTACDGRTINVAHPVKTLDNIIPIQPSANAISGTVWLADRVTPCFRFDSQALTAKVSLLDGNEHIVAGPVNGNNVGQYALPVSVSADNLKLHVVCDKGSADTTIQKLSGFLVQDVAIANHAPQILSLDFSKGSVGIRRANPGEIVRATVKASDLDGDTLHYRWVDDSGRSLGLPDAPSVDWQVINANVLNTLHVQVSDDKGGFAISRRTLQSGPNAIFFAGRVFNRQTLAAVNHATVSLNKVVVQTDATGNFRVSVPDAPQFVLNVTKPGFALASLIYRTYASNIQVPLDAVQTVDINAGTGGSINFPPAGCLCQPRDHEKQQREGYKDDKNYYDKDDDTYHCDKGKGMGTLKVKFQPDSFMTSTGGKYSGTVSLEGFQYDLTQPNPIPGDLGAIYQGKMVRLSSFGAFHILSRDSQNKPLKMAANMKASVSFPIQAAQQATAPATIPFFHYDEDKGLWVEDGTLTRSGNQYVGEITHFTAFNADTQFDGGACVKVVLDDSFHFPVTLNASYFDAGAGQFYHNGLQTNDKTIGVERMRPNQNFTLSITNNGELTPTVSVPLNSGAGLNPVTFPGGLDTDQINFSHCNGPVQIYNKTIPVTKPTFLGPIFGGSITDNSVSYQHATDAQSGGTRDTLNKWKTANGFSINGSPVSLEAKAIYFNNGDLKFGRDMHCRVTNAVTHATACYVSNFGQVGFNDETVSLPQAVAYEASGQATPQPVATVAMEYSPAGDVQFYAYKSDGSYLAHPVLDSQAITIKPIPDMCLACHQGTYSPSNPTTDFTTKVSGAHFLPFDLDSFNDDTGTAFPQSINYVTPALQEQLRQLNNMVANTNAPPGVTEAIQLWYPGGVANPNTPYVFNRGAAQLPGAPFSGHEPLYDNVVKVVCRTCHMSDIGHEWDQFTPQMTSASGFIQSLACGPQLEMPHAEVPWNRYWQQSLSSTLDSELNFGGAGCPNH